MFVQLWVYYIYWIVQFVWVNCMVCRLYLNKAVKKILSSSDSLYDLSINPFIYSLIQHIFVAFLPCQQLGIGW